MIRRSTLLACGVFLLLPTVTFAQNSTWTGAGDGTTWEDVNNWDTGTVPTGGNAIIGNATISVTGVNPMYNDLDLAGDNTTGTTAVLDQTAGSLTGGGWAKVGVNATNDGTYNLSGTASSTGHTQLHAGSRGGTGVINLIDSASFSHSQSLRLSDDGANVGGSGTLNVSNNASFDTGDNWILGNNNGGLGVVNLSDSATATVGNQVRVGSGTGGTGVVNLSDGATATVGGRFQVGFGGTGTVNIADGTMLNVDNLSVGRDDGTGVVNQTGGTVTSNTWLALGQGTNAGVGSGTYNHSAGTIQLNGDWFTIGESNAGTYNGSGTAVVNAANNGVIVGRDGNGDGLLELDGSAVTFTTDGEVRIGIRSQGNDAGAMGEISWIADAAGVSTIFADGTTNFGANADLSVDLTADANFSNWTTTGFGPLMDIAVLIDNMSNVSTGIGASQQMFAGAAEGSLVSIGGGQQAFITYNGGADGNDIVLRVYDINVVPEPGSAAILALAGMGLMFRRRRN